MTRQETISELKKYFDIRELVCKHTFDTFKDNSWQFFDRDFLEMLLILRRDIIKSEMKINNWHSGGTFTQRGIRCNICQLVRDKTLRLKIYMSSHPNGAGIDFNAKGQTAQQSRELIKKNANLLPCNVRCESDVDWCHIDIYDNGLKYSEFKG
jgi:hypothetical protein